MSNDYRPTQHGIQSNLRHSIEYCEYAPTSSLAEVVSCFWLLRSRHVLDCDFVYTIMPDACVDIVINAIAMDKVLLMTPQLAVEEVNLGKNFYYIGVRLLPGALKSKTISARAIVGGQLRVENLDGVNLQHVTQAIINQSGEMGKRRILEELVTDLYGKGVVGSNYVVTKAIADMQDNQPQEQIAQKLGYSSRQLRRIITNETGFTPIQLLRIVRFQQAISRQDISLRFADQSHLIKEFQNITGKSFHKFTKDFS